MQAESSNLMRIALLGADPETLRIAAAAIAQGHTLAAASEAGRNAAEVIQLAPFIEAAMTRKQWMQPLADDEIPVVKASVQRAVVGQ